jgi:hypothetical protein
MSFYAAWVLAEQADAAAVRTTVTTKEHQLEEWEHLILKGVDGPEINKLERLVRPRVKGKKVTMGGQLLVRGKFTDEPFTCVSRVAPEFVDRLASMSTEEVTTLATQWQKQVVDQTVDALIKLVQAMAAFAAKAKQAFMPVLQLDRL